jgi:hypothetical protein
MNEIKPLAWFKPLAWLGDPGLKEEVVLRMKEHRAEDSIIQGHYQLHAPELASGYKGCLLGCTLPKMRQDHTLMLMGWHERVEDLYGIPADVAALLEAVFENMSSFDKAADFAVESIEAIPVGADLSKVREYYTQCINRATWSPSRCRKKILDLLRNAPVPEPVQ